MHFNYVIIFFSSIFVQAQSNINFDAIVLNNNSFYLVCRGTNQKTGTIVKKFNLSDKNVTHVGIGIVEHGRLRIYDVNNNQKSGRSALSEEDLSAFTILADSYYLSVWECHSSKKELHVLRHILRSYHSKKIVFDMAFNEKDDDHLYCSEFCAKVLHTLNPLKFHFSLTKTQLSGMFEIMLGKKILNYYPVDFFQSNAAFAKVYERFLN